MLQLRLKLVESQLRHNRISLDDAVLYMGILVDAGQELFSWADPSAICPNIKTYYPNKHNHFDLTAIVIVGSALWFGVPLNMGHTVHISMTLVLVVILVMKIRRHARLLRELDKQIKEYESSGQTHS
jgi:hypothetical protein